MELPRNMRKPRSAGKAHFYVDPTGIDIYPNGLGRVYLNRRQLRQALKVMDDFEAKIKDDSTKGE
jgi:hypothetical protein